MANRLVGNAPEAAALECTLAGPSLRFNCATVVAVTGAPASLTLDGQPLAMWQAHRVEAGSVLAVGRCSSGCRLSIAVAGGLDVPTYLGSRATFTLGQFGGHAGRHLRMGDVLHLCATATDTDSDSAKQESPTALAAPEGLIPAYDRHWHIGVLYGPHGAPDFFQDGDIATFFATDWEVHYNSSRTGVRLIGPKPQWARSDGGEAGLHPSNIHDNAYAIGAIDFTGDMPVILGPDGPSLGGFVCPAVVVNAELWKLGQLRPGDTVRFHRLSLAQAAERQAAMEAALAGQTTTLPPAPEDDAQAHTTPVIHDDPAHENARDAVPAMVIRQAGDRYVLVEFGPLVLDIELRLRVHVLMTALQAQRDSGALPGIIDTTPGIRSLQVHFDPARLPRDALLKALVAAEAALPAIDDIEVPSRTVYLPLSWDDPQTRLAIEKYMQSVRPDAPWCPSNIEFIRRINGLERIEDVFTIVFDASYLVMGLGDVYLGAPVATPLDPRHRLVTTKYNPARTWTPENAVGIGGAYLCVYGMEGPGGYQFVGRTLQMWNRWRHGTSGTPSSNPGCCASSIRSVSTWSRKTSCATSAPTSPRRLPPAHRRRPLQPEGLPRLSERQRGLHPGLQVAAANGLRSRARALAASGQLHFASDADIAAAGPDDELDLPEGSRVLAASVPGNVWHVAVSEGQRVNEGDLLLVIESMKMEFSVLAPASGTVHQLLCTQGAPVAAGQNLVVLLDAATADAATALTSQSL
ncbi:MAG: 5-oxoprolinase/urea amidolyase family protein [Burkholderiaceae bacterium]